LAHTTAAQPASVAAQEELKLDIFWGCLGVAAIILALGAVHSIPSVLALLERVALHDPTARRPGPPAAPPPSRSDTPWG
jgi:hypothetical protein